MNETLKEKLESVRALLDTMEGDALKSDEGTLAAGGRVRKHLQELKRLAQEARVFCLERDHSRKSK
jgi:hypothetical protein